MFAIFDDIICYPLLLPIPPSQITIILLTHFGKDLIATFPLIFWPRDLWGSKAFPKSPYDRPRAKIK